MKLRKLFTALSILALTLVLTVSLHAQDKKTLNISFVQTIDTLNWDMYSNQFFSSILGSLWNSPAWVFDDQLNPVPRLVTEIPSADNGGVSKDGKTLTLKLRRDIKWSDGEPITADDFVFTYQMYMADKNTVTSRTPYDLMDSVTAQDPQTVVVKFKDVYAPWLGSIFKMVMPKHTLQPVFDKVGSLDKADFNNLPSPSSGPFLVSDYQPDQYILFTRNASYFDPPAKLDQIYIRFVQDDAAQIAALLNGDVDLGVFIAADDAKNLSAKGIGIVKVSSGYNEGIYFNFKDDGNHTAIRDLAVRQAIAYGLNRDGITKDLNKFGAGDNDYLPIADTFWHNFSWADPSIKHEAFDPDKAKKILDDAGWKDSNGDGTRDKGGVELKLIWATNQRTLREQVQAVGKQQLADIGIDVELVNYPSDTFFGSLADGSPVAEGQYDLQEYSGQPTSFPDPNTDIWLCKEIPSDANQTGTNTQYLCDKDLDALFQQQASLADPAARREIFFKIEKLMADKLYWMPLWNDPDLWAVAPRFENPRLAGITQFWNSANWDVK